ncbi:MAG: hypothetical protein IJP29_08190, partial [Lachnospiraceae bacterium]|nr:hypothetical protein [Lachnospiraceae bacterium]
MKLYIITIILALCMVACGRDSKQREMLMQVESFMEERPDSALIVLQSIDIEDDEYGQMLMHYVQGRLQQEAEDYPASIISMFNAEKTAKKHGASDILGLIYYSLSDTYKSLYNPIERQNYAQLAYNHFILSGDTCHIYLGMETLAEANYDNRNYDKSASLAQQMVTHEKAVPNPQIKIRGLRLLSSSYIKMQKYEEAKTTLHKLKKQADSLTNQDYRNLCLAYIKLGDLDSANVYRKFAQTSEQKSLWVVVKDPQTGEPIANIFELEDKTTAIDTLSQKIVNQNIAQTIANYHAYEQNLQEVELRNEKMSKMVIVTVALLLLVFSFLWYRLHLKAHRKEMEMKMMEAENIRHILKVTKDDASAMQQSVNQLFEQKFKSIDELCNTYYVYQGSQNERTKIYNNVIGLISNLSKDKKTIAELEAFVNTYKNNLMVDFRTEYPILKEEDYL